MHGPEYWIKHLHLEKHPEGGYFRENYRSGESIRQADLPARFSGSRNFSTGIYYLLAENDISALHRIKSDELWHHYAGGKLYIHMIDEAGIYSRICLGTGPDRDEFPQFAVPAGVWFAAEPAEESGYCLCGCTVAPGFDFADFEMPSRDRLLELFPEHREVITRLSYK